MASVARPAPGAGAGAGGKSGEPVKLSGVRLLLAGFTLAMANFIVVLDTTIANVSVPHISGGLAVSVSSGTWVITSYAVAEAICVPLTGWLSARFGTLRVFLFSLIGFGVFSALCGISNSLSMLVIFRLGQGFAGGPLLPLTQTLLLRIFPKEMHSKAMAGWAMTVVVAPIVGPLLGGYISDNWSWPWIFFINLPIIAIIFLATLALLRGAETPTQKQPIDKIGLILLIIWVGAFQMMIDLGREEDWFSSEKIVALAVIAAIFFAIFLIWELTEDHPIVDLKVFRHRGFSASTFSLTLAFGTYFASIVIIPQWLQTSLGYTASDAGVAMAFSGVLAVMVSPLVPQLMKKFDPRLLVFVGISWIGVIAGLRAITWSSESPFWVLAAPQLLQGAGTALFIVPLTTISLGSVEPREVASAAGIASFGRTLAGAVATALITTLWSNLSRADSAEMAANLNGSSETMAKLQAAGMSSEQARAALAQMVANQGTALGTTHMFAIAGVILFLAATSIWLVPKTNKVVEPGLAH